MMNVAFQLFKALSAPEGLAGFLRICKLKSRKYDWLEWRLGAGAPLIVVIKMGQWVATSRYTCGGL